MQCFDEANGKYSVPYDVAGAKAALAVIIGSVATAQTMSPPVTMQPVPNPPEKAAPHPHKAKHHHAKAATPATADSKAPSAN